ncbi:MAG: CoA-binding protein [Candidatus Kapabacteria bacterium]|nr:CoA-binding protein [Candidatus Kapabacteria bacterium]
MDSVEIMRNTKSFAIIGASAKEESYGFKLVKNLIDAGYVVYPMNPKYPKIYGINTFQFFSDLPDSPNNIVLAMSLANNLIALEQIEANCNSYIWFPPECWNDEIIAKAKDKNLKFLKDVCPIGTYLLLNFSSEIK